MPGRPPPTARLATPCTSPTKPERSVCTPGAPTRRTRLQAGCPHPAESRRPPREGTQPAFHTSVGGCPTRRLIQTRASSATPKSRQQGVHSSWASSPTFGPVRLPRLHPLKLHPARSRIPLFHPPAQPRCHPSSSSLPAHRRIPPCRPSTCALEGSHAPTTTTDGHAAAPPSDPAGNSDPDGRRRNSAQPGRCRCSSSVPKPSASPRYPRGTADRARAKAPAQRTLETDPGNAGTLSPQNPVFSIQTPLLPLL